jgi:dCTP diphosphatase
VQESARLYFAADATLVVLEIDPRTLSVPVDVANTPRGPMPHVHGAIARASVRRVLSLESVPQCDDALDPRSLDALQREVRAFNDARAWRQFHSPKNLAMALSIEAAELAEPFRWDTDSEAWARAQTADGRAHLAHEMADVLLLLLSLADYNDVDLLDAARAKLALNAARYPEDKARGRAEKYTAYEASADEVNPRPRDG